MLDGFDFLTSEFFNAVLREQKSVLIHPYVAPEKLNLFLTVLPCYSIIEIDVSDMDMEETFEWMIHSYSAEPKDARGLSKPLLFLTNLTASQAKRLSREEEMHFIAIVKESVKEDDIGSSRVLVYNRNLGSFTNYTPKSREPEMFEDIIVQKLKETQNHTAAKKLIMDLIQKAKKIYEYLILDDFDSLYPEIKALNSIQKDFVKDFLSYYFRISIDSDLFIPSDTVAKLQKHEIISEEERIQNQKELSKSSIKDTIKIPNSNKIKNTASQLKSPRQNQGFNQKQSMSKDSEIDPSTSSIDNSKDSIIKIPDVITKNKEIGHATEPNLKYGSKKGTKSNNEHNSFESSARGSIKESYLKELKAIRSSKIGIGQIFDYCLESMRFLDGFKDLKDPQALYHCLRESKWKSGIPSQFLLELYRTKINSTLKSFSTLNSDDYILMLEDTKKELLTSIKNVPKAQDFEMELEEYIQRILKQREFQEIREEMKESIQQIKSTYSDHLNEKYKQNHIEIIPLGLNVTSNNSKIPKIPCGANQNVAESNPKKKPSPNHNCLNRSMETRIANNMGQQNKSYATDYNQVQYSDSIIPISMNIQPDDRKGAQMEGQNISRSFSESITKLNGVMNRLELCLKYIAQSKNHEEGVK